ncbi:hypothetical protein HMP06_0201 [Sphingomonas sp. HMP6]|nr:hypothetical protein HMP06_0201 [Sphingomonas sp. HMP6]
MLLAGVLLALIAPPGGDTSACRENPCGVTEVLPNILAWDGRIVRVRGWLRCPGNFTCQLEPSATPDYEHSATIDYVKAMEPKLKALNGAQIVLLARVTAQCSGEEICTDRGPELIPLRIERVLDRPKPPAKKAS